MWTEHVKDLPWYLKHIDAINIPLKSIRFTYEGNTIFLSVGKKSLGELFINDSIIRVSVVSSAAAVADSKNKLAENEVSSVIKSKKKGDNNRNKLCFEWRCNVIAIVKRFDWELECVFQGVCTRYGGRM